MSVYHEGILQSRRLLLDELEQINEQQFNVRVNDESWSIAQICKHILLCEQLFHIAIKRALQSEDRHVGHVSIDKLYNDKVKYEAPSKVVPEHKAYSKSLMLEELQRCRFDILTTLDCITNEAMYKMKACKHYLFGDLNIAQWLEVIAAHELRHIQQIRKQIA